MCVGQAGEAAPIGVGRPLLLHAGDELRGRARPGPERPARLPLVLGARNHYSRSLPAEASHAPLKALAVRALYPQADLIIGVAQGVCDDLAENFGVPRARLRAIHNPLDLAGIARQATAPVDHPWLAPGADRPVILNVGKLQVAKAQADLIAAFRLVRDRLPARLVILGQGPLRQELESLTRRLGLEQDVAFLGFQNNPYAFMARSSVFVLSSAWEGFPNVLAEAMAAGPAVISTDCPSGPSEIIRDGRQRPADARSGQPERLAAPCCGVLGDESLRQAPGHPGLDRRPAMGRSAHRRALRRLLRRAGGRDEPAGRTLGERDGRGPAGESVVRPNPSELRYVVGILGLTLDCASAGWSAPADCRRYDERDAAQVRLGPREDEARVVAGSS